MLLAMAVTGGLMYGLWLVVTAAMERPNAVPSSGWLALAIALSGVVALTRVRTGHAQAAPGPVIVVGHGPVAAVVMSAMTLDHPKVTRIVKASSTANVATEAEAHALLAENPYQTVIVATDEGSFSWPGRQPKSSRVLSAPDIVAEIAGRVPMNLVPIDPSLRTPDPVVRLSTVHRLLKRGFDLVFVTCAGSLFLLMLPFLALAIRLDSPGPIFYRQTRIGLGNKPFSIVKLRTMRADAEKAGPQWAQERDSRVTRIGGFLRQSRIDELPQLWNVLRGDMTLIGPRPERPEFTQQLERILPHYAKRHAVKPGLTGWAQVRYRYASSVNDSAVKLEHDLYYIKRLSLRLDVLILLLTVQVVLRLRGR